MTRVLLCTALALSAGCAKSGNTGPSGKGDLVLTATWPAPVKCGQWTKNQSSPSLDVSDPTGCNATVRFRLAPSGQRDLELPFFRDNAKSLISQRADGERVVERVVVLRDLASENLWQVDIPESALPTSDTCKDAGAESRTSIDLNSWRFTVVRVSARDAWGALRPIAENQADTLTLLLTPEKGDPVRPVLVPSTSHSGVWAAVWCKDSLPGRATARLDVRGAYQINDDTFTVPAHAGEVYTVLSYNVEAAGSAP